MNAFGLLKISRYFRAQSLIVQSRLRKDQKSTASCGYYFVLLLIYLHMVGCLFFFFCLQTYNVSSTKIGILEGLNLHDYNSQYIDEIGMAKQNVISKGHWHAGNDETTPANLATVHAWVPAFDNYDGTE